MVKLDKKIVELKFAGEGLSHSAALYFIVTDVLKFLAVLFLLLINASEVFDLPGAGFSLESLVTVNVFLLSIVLCLFCPAIRERKFFDIFVGMHRRDALIKELVEVLVFLESEDILTQLQTSKAWMLIYSETEKATSHGLYKAYSEVTRSIEALQESLQARNAVLESHLACTAQRV